MAENNGKIYIYISDKAPSGAGGTGTDTESGQSKKKNEDNKMYKFLKQELYYFAKSEANNIVNTSIGMIGDLTGNYQTQRNVQASVSMLNKVKGLALAGYGGFTATGTMAGGLIGLGVALASATINTGIQVFQETRQNRITNEKIDRLREISGLDQLTNGSR